MRIEVLVLNFMVRIEVLVLNFMGARQVAASFLLNEKIKREIGWRQQYESWRRGFFEDAAAVAPGGVA